MAMTSHLESNYLTVTDFDTVRLPEKPVLRIELLPTLLNEPELLNDLEPLAPNDRKRGRDAGILRNIRNSII